MTVKSPTVKIYPYHTHLNFFVADISQVYCNKIAIIEIHWRTIKLKKHLKLNELIITNN